jgi:hypothetical protein
MKKLLFKSFTALFLALVFLFVTCDGEPSVRCIGQCSMYCTICFCPGCGELQDDCVCAFGPCDICEEAQCACIIVSPYRNVNWAEWEQFKAALHSHTTNSDGGATLSAVIEEHYTKGYDILAITDHNIVTGSSWRQHFTNNWLLDDRTPNGLTAERRQEILSGTDRGGRGMLEIPYAAEVAAWPCEFNAFFNYNIEFAGGNNFLRTAISRAHNTNAIMHINHPGRSTGGNDTSAWGLLASNEQATVRNYVNLFLEFPNLVGMEIVNRVTDADSRHDRILWDNILKQTMSKGRFVWGFSNDDSHSNANVGHNYNMFIMPENTLPNVRSAMINGHFYAVARRVHLEAVNNAPVTDAQARDMLGAGVVFPSINSIEVCLDDLTITINAADATSIVWISNGEVILTTSGVSSTFALNDFPAAIIYVRANIIGSGGIAFTQPFGIQR